MSEPKSERDLFVDCVRMREHSHTLRSEVFADGQYAIIKDSADAVSSTELAAKDAIIAELVRLLRRGADLYDFGFWASQFPKDRAEWQRKSMGVLEQYDEAIEQYGKG